MRGVSVHLLCRVWVWLFLAGLGWAGTGAGTGTGTGCKICCIVLATSSLRHLVVERLTPHLVTPTTHVKALVDAWTQFKVRPLLATCITTFEDKHSISAVRQE